MPKSKETVRTSVELPAAVHRKLRETAAKRGCSARSLIVEAVTRLMDEPASQPVDEKPKKELRRLSLDPPLIPSRERGLKLLTNDEIYKLIDFP